MVPKRRGSFGEYFSNLDIFGLPVSLFIKGKENKRKSVVGAFFSVVLCGLIAAYVQSAIDTKIRKEQNIN